MLGNNILRMIDQELEETNKYEDALNREKLSESKHEK
jgi:hypothetical protein